MLKQQLKTSARKLKPGCNWVPKYSDPKHTFIVDWLKDNKEENYIQEKLQSNTNSNLY